MVYVDTQRPLWCARITFGNFAGTMLLLGATFGAVLFGWLGNFTVAQPCAIAALVIRTTLFLWRRGELRAAWHDAASPIHFNARIIRTLLPRAIAWRTWLFVASTIFGLMAIANLAGVAPLWASVAAITTFSSEIIARHVFFVASASKHMPGGVNA
jgi:DMSO reductase anchor subunit